MLTIFVKANDDERTNMYHNDVDLSYYKYEYVYSSIHIPHPYLSVSKMLMNVACCLPQSSSPVLGECHQEPKLCL